MDRSQTSSSALDELRQIQYEVKRARKLDDLRFYFDRVQNLRRLHADDFDLQLVIAEVQEQVIERGRQLRSLDVEQPQTRELPLFDRMPAVEETKPADWKASDAQEPAVEEPAGVQKLDEKTWQRATYLALFFALLLFFAFFYLVQTARRLNFPQTAETTAPQAPAATSRDSKNADAKSTERPAQPAAPTTTTPLVRVFTDLIPATYSLDDKEPAELKDGELTLDKLEPGRHSLKITGKYASAAVSFDVTENGAPRVIGQPVASNVMAVAVSAQNGQGKLITNAENPTVLVDGNTAGAAETDGLTLANLGTTDHDIQVTESKDRQRFVLTYTAAPSLTLYVKADPYAGTVVVTTGQDEADVYVNDKLYRRRTDRGQVRIPLKVGEYAIRVHKAGFIDPPPQTVQVKKAEESPLEFKFEPVPQIATLQVKGAAPGTMIYLDKDVAAVIGGDGNATISNVKPGDHSIELRLDQAVPKHFDRTFKTGDVITLAGADTTLEKPVADTKQAQQAPPPATPVNANGSAAPEPTQVVGQQVRKGGGFIPYSQAKSAGRYSFQAQSRKGGLFKRPKVQWYAGYVDPDNYVLYTLDGKRATVREVKNGKSTELGKIPFEFGNDEWVQVDMSVRSNTITSRVKTPNGDWQELSPVTDVKRDLTQNKVGMYIPGNDEVAIANFRFSSR